MSIKGEKDKDDIVHRFSGIFLSHLKEWDNAIWSNVDGFGNYGFRTKWSKTEKVIWYHLYVGSKNNDTNELIYKAESDLENELIYKAESDLENELMVTRGKARGEIDWEFGNSMYTLYNR